MLGIGRRSGPLACESFYRNLFALLTFAAFGVALATNAPLALCAALAFGALSRTAARKGWKNPAFAERLHCLVYRSKEDLAEK